MNSFINRKGKKGSSSTAKKKPEAGAGKPKLEELIKNRDYTGAVILLEFQAQQKDNADVPNAMHWLAYASFHLGDYQKALDTYNKMMEKADADANNHLYMACCLYYLGHYTTAQDRATKGPDSTLKNRVLFHCAHKLGDEKTLMTYHNMMTEQVEDQVSLAAVHYLRSHYQESTEIYKKLLKDAPDNLAIQVYVALCYYKLDYYDVSLEILEPYLQKHPDSAIAINLKACNHYKLYDGKAAEAELKGMMDTLAATSQNIENELLKHNTVVFRRGANALQVFPPLLDLIPEARLNLVIFHLHNNEIMDAYKLIKDLEPNTPQEYILKGVVNASLGQMNDSPEHIKLAQQFFQLVGSSASECDTIPGRQCMASCFFLMKQFEDVLVYLNSVKAYSYTDAHFAYNYGVALASVGRFAEAEQEFLTVQDEMVRQEYGYLSWLARCFIMDGKPREAWELYLKMDSNTDSFAMLVLISNDCYKVGSFFYAAKAFDVLERLDPSPEYWEGKRGACCGVFQQVIARKEKKSCLRDVIMMLQTNVANPQVEFIVQVMTKWANQNQVEIH